MDSCSDFCAFCPVVNRPDLLVRLIAAAVYLHDDFTVIDNSGCGIAECAASPWSSVKVFRPPIPLTFTQTMNWQLEETLRRGKPYCIQIHNDAVIPDGACEKLLDYARNNTGERRWGVIYTNYDVLCIHNPQVYKNIGGYDINLPQYFSDNDYFRRMDLAGWERIDTGIEVGHGQNGQGSQTINSDPYLKHVNNVTFPLYREYYRAKWGGYPEQEKFIHPFGILPREWALARSM